MKKVKNEERKKKKDEKKKKNNLSEVELTEFLLDFNKKASILIKTLLFSLLFYSLFVFYAFLINFILNIISLLVLSFSFLYLGKYKIIDFKQYDAKKIKDFILYMEPQDNLPEKNKKKGKKKIGGKKKKKEKSFNEIVNIIETLAQDYFIKMINRSGLIWVYYIFVIIFFSPAFIFVVGLPFIYTSSDLFAGLSGILNSIMVNVISIIGVIMYSISSIYLFSKITDFTNVKRCSELFKSRVDQKLETKVKALKAFLKCKTEYTELDEINLIQSLQQWYEFYCSNFSNHDKLNEIISKYYKFIFSTKQEFFFLELFLNVKGKIKDYQEVQSYKGKNQTVSIFSSALKKIENYIDILKNNIDTDSKRKKELRERWNIVKTFLYLIIAPTSFMFSIIAILKP